MYVGVTMDPRYIHYLEYDVDNDTNRWVYFDAQYRDPNLRLDKETKQWVSVHSLLEVQTITLWI